MALCRSSHYHWSRQDSRTNFEWTVTSCHKTRAVCHLWVLKSVFRKSINQKCIILPQRQRKRGSNVINIYDWTSSPEFSCMSSLNVYMILKSPGIKTSEYLTMFLKVESVPKELLGTSDRMTRPYSRIASELERWLRLVWNLLTRPGLLVVSYLEMMALTISLRMALL